MQLIRQFFIIILPQILHTLFPIGRGLWPRGYDWGVMSGHRNQPGCRIEFRAFPLKFLPRFPPRRPRLSVTNSGKIREN